MLARRFFNRTVRLSSLSPAVMLGARARPLRFVAVGAFAGLLQLSLLVLFTGAGWQPLVANVVAFLISAQVNFGLSQAFTWGDRGVVAQAVLARWGRFHASIAGTALLNMATFTVTRTIMPDVPASVVGIAFASLANFLLGDKFVFRKVANGGESQPVAFSVAAAGDDFALQQATVKSRRS